MLGGFNLPSGWSIFGIQSGGFSRGGNDFPPLLNLEFSEFYRRYFCNHLISYKMSYFRSEFRCPFASKLWGLLPKFPFAHWKEFWTILEFASLQIQNSPCGLRHWICGRSASLRMVHQNSLMFAPGNQGNGLFRRDSSPANLVHGHRCSLETQETPVPKWQLQAWQKFHNVIS